MPVSRYVLLIAAVVLAAGLTVAFAALVAPGLGDGAWPFVVIAALLAAAAARGLGRR